MNFVRIVISILIQMSFLLIYPIYHGFAEGQDIVVQTMPEKEFLTLQNMAPGKSETKIITIQNNGKSDFNYTTKFKLKSGSEKQFNELLLTILRGDKMLFEGRMKDFKRLEPRQLKENMQEALSFIVSVPTNAGNDFQGLSCEVEITFNAKGVLDGLFNGGSALPDTGTNMFNYLISGTVLIICGLIFQIFSLKRGKLH